MLEHIRGTHLVWLFVHAMLAGNLDKLHPQRSVMSLMAQIVHMSTELERSAVHRMGSHIFDRLWQRCLLRE